MVLDEKQILSRLKGAFAEKLFELIHIEMGCEVYRTGHELVFPHLFDLANFKRKSYHFVNGETDLQIENENRKKMYELEKEMNPHWKVPGPFYLTSNSLKQARLHPVPELQLLAAMPDFTVISATGLIFQFEVKFRKHSKLEPEEIDKYLRLSNKPFIFLISSEPPHIRIFDAVSDDPDWGFTEGSLAEKRGDEISNLAYDLATEHLRTVGKPYNENDEKSVKFHDDYGWHVRLALCNYRYEEVLPDEFGDIRIGYSGVRYNASELVTDLLVYRKNILEKYSKIIISYFK
jgi:hypothetical protein